MGELQATHELFASLISDIKGYSGKDPLLPWLRGVSKIKECLPPHMLNQKLPRFLQKCAQTFQHDTRYRNDLRYLRVWIQLMDFVDNPRKLLRAMEMNRIGRKRAVYYQAYALYYEKHKKFSDSENMYHLGIKNLAEPADELKKSYEQFLHRMEMHKKRRTRIQDLKTAKNNNKAKLGAEGEGYPISQSGKNQKHTYSGSNGSFSQASLSRAKHIDVEKDKVIEEKPYLAEGAQKSSAQSMNVANENDDTIVVCRFVDSAIDGKSEAEDACHHGLVDPTVNMKEAMNDINSMFREPLEVFQHKNGRKAHRNLCQVNKEAGSTGFVVFVDESFDKQASLCNPKARIDADSLIDLPIANETNVASRHTKTGSNKSSKQETFKILADDSDDMDNDNNDSRGNKMGYSEYQREEANKSVVSINPKQDFQILCENNDDDSDDDQYRENFLQPHMNVNEDTVVCRFVGSTILGESQVENACHHGLVDPTVNLKEAIQDINSMFGKPLDFVNNKSKKQSRISEEKKRKEEGHGFSILADDECLEGQETNRSASGQGLHLSNKLAAEFDLFEPTVFTKEAMAEINDMFGRPLDFF